MQIRPARRGDNESWAAMRTALWPDAEATAVHLEIERWWWTGDRDTSCLVAEEHGRIVGFIELSVRSYAEGCETDRVAFVEGWYVAPDARQRGVGRGLIEAAEAWSRRRGCTELGSDADLDNLLGHDVHLACGFTEVARVVCYRKSLT